MTDLALLIPACFALNLTFGPSNLLALTHGAQAGPRFAMQAGIGRLLVYGPMIGLTALGLGLLLSASALAFTVVKIAGAAYLVWIGVRILRAARAASAAGLDAPPPDAAAAFRREVFTALSNPKAMVIFVAFFPQFIDPAAYWQSYAILIPTFLALEMAAIFLYALGGRFAARSAGNAMRWVNTGSGLGMIGFGALLLLARRPEMA